MKYGTGKAADNICTICGRGGARDFDGRGGRAHSKCKHKNYRPDPPRHWWRCGVCGTMNTTTAKREPHECEYCHKAVKMEYRGHGIRPNVKDEARL